MGFDVGSVILSSPGTTLAVDGASRWMNVNASGILTRPQTPFMRGTFSGRGNPYNAGGGSLLVTSQVNVGNCWNNATGYWTCPVAGYYLATGGGIAGPSGYGYFYAQKNGANQHWSHWNHTSSWHYVTLSSVMSCAANDTIRWVLGSYSPATAGFYGEVNHNMWSIALMA
jgi:hypothetical protein